MWVDAPVDLEVAAQQFHPGVSGFTRDHLHCVMQADQTTSLGELGSQSIEMGDCQMSAATITVDHDRVGFRNQRIVFGPAADDLNLHVGVTRFD